MIRLFNREKPGKETSVYIPLGDAFRIELDDMMINYLAAVRSERNTLITAELQKVRDTVPHLKDQELTAALAQARLHDAVALYPIILEEQFKREDHPPKMNGKRE